MKLPAATTTAAVMFSLAAPAQAFGLPPASASWTAWASALTTVLTGSLTQNGNTVGVSYSGDRAGLDFDASYFDTPGSFTNAVVTNTPQDLGTVRMVGGAATVNRFHFSSAVIDPVIALFSVGQANTPARFVFLDSPSVVIGAQGSGHWGGGSLVLSTPFTVSGVEGNGLLQFKGTYTDLRFTTPDFENYYGATVGAMTTAVPEPQTLALMLAGLLAGATVLRHQRTPTARTQA
jgi:hypothetical protein